MTLMTVVLFAFWIVLSGKFDPFHLSLGILSALGVAFATRNLGRLAPRIRGGHSGTWLHWPLYLPWLAWQVVLSAVQVTAIVLHPRLPISPRLIKFRCKLPNTVAHLTLANSITLTPGTVTIDLHGDSYTIHALTREAAESLVPKQGEGEMQKRVQELFSEAQSS
ncbi:MAG: Na+/H+ antiporter subunit E [Elusimicrobiota bacterium]